MEFNLNGLQVDERATTSIPPVFPDTSAGKKDSVQYCLKND